MELPNLPFPVKDFVSHLEKAKTRKAVKDLTDPFVAYESKLREIYAQHPTHTAVPQNHLVPVFQNDNSDFTIRARDLEIENSAEKGKYLLPLSDSQRKKTGDPAATTTLKEFQYNFALFSEQALSDLKWDNIVVSGSAVLTALLPVNAPHNASKRALRSYYHEQLAPASDVDIFIYGLDEAQAIEKIKEIEASVRNSVLSEVTVVRAKNAITIVSEYPIRHVQIVLRLYKSVTEILTGFDVDCACLAYDGKQVWAAPRALAALCTQTNHVDLTRRSPSYENRLSKYAHRGFEVYWPPLDRSRIDPTIFERSFNRVLGLARLLVLEKLPHPQDRDDYLKKRREERGRPELSQNWKRVNKLHGNVKDVQPDDVPDWIEEDQASNYHTFTLPWGPKYGPKRIERLLYSKDLLLNAEWNKPKDRESNLHRHPAFFGRVKDVIEDCCGYCPKPVTDEDLAVLEEESKTFITGAITFIKDDPGRQAIGSFHPLTDDDWVDMAYIGNTTKLCQAIVAQDQEAVLDWLKGGDADVTRRDHTGRTPLQLAVMCSSAKIVQCLIDHGARINARLYNGFTALHLAAQRGSVEMVKALLDKSAENEREVEQKEEKRKTARREKITSEAGPRANDKTKADDKDVDDDKRSARESSSDTQSIEVMDLDSERADEDDDDVDMMTDGSFVKVGTGEGIETQDNPEDPDVLDVSVVAWDSTVSPLHLAILAGHENAIRLLIKDYGADPLLPVKIMSDYTPREPEGAILSLLLAQFIPSPRAVSVVKTLIDAGTSPFQADMERFTALHQFISDDRFDLFEALQRCVSGPSISKLINHLFFNTHGWSTIAYSPLLSAIRNASPRMADNVLSMSEHAEIDFDTFTRKCDESLRLQNKEEGELEKLYRKSVEQPIVLASQSESTVHLIPNIVSRGVDVNSMSPSAWEVVHEPSYRTLDGSGTVLDNVRSLRAKLEDFIKQKSELQHAEALENDDHYLQGIQDGTYQYMSAKGDLERAKLIRADRLKMFKSEYDEAERLESSAGRRAKRAAAADLAKEFKAIEESLISKGAKGVRELHPNLEKDKDNKDEKDTGNDEEASKNAYSTKFSFDDGHMSATRRSKYIQLFEAAFTGDVATVKDLCTKMTGKSSPLKIAVNDHNGFNCFSLAVLQGHYDLACIVLEIAAAQHKEKDDTGGKHYSLQRYNGDSDDDEQDARPRVYEHLIQDQVTIDNIHEIPQNVTSERTPVDMINNSCDVLRMMDTPRVDALRKLDLDVDVYRSSYRSPYRQGLWEEFKDTVQSETQRTSVSLWMYAAQTRNLQLLEFLLKMENTFTMIPPDERLGSFEDLTVELGIAMESGNLPMLSTIISQRGVSLPLDHLAETSGVVIKETPKYYQGLSVYGEKRKDWARRDGETQPRSMGESGSPLLQAIMRGNLETIKYFMSDLPAQKYEEFTGSFGKDKRIRSLAEGNGGIPAAIELWMNTRVDLALHMAVLSSPSRGIERLEFLLKKLPKTYLEVKSSDGYTPLHLAANVENIPAFERLLAEKTDLRTKDRKGYNLLHTICSASGSTIRPKILKLMLEMLDGDVVQDLLLEKTDAMEPTSLTPFALRLRTDFGDSKAELEIYDWMLDRTDGKVLSIMDGSGDYPLHRETRCNRTVRAVHFAKRQPQLLYKENATGMTPIDVAYTAYLQNCTSSAPTPSDRCRTDSILDKSDESFLSDKNEDESNKMTDDDEYGDVPTVYPIYAALVRIARAHPQPRQLVSILDSNEVARRLANEQRRKNLKERQKDAVKTVPYGASAKSKKDRQIDDEVNANEENARQSMRSVPCFDHVGNDMDDIRAAYQKWRDFAGGKTTVLKCCDKADEMDRDKREGHHSIKA